jgi:AraC-like DNA-binding protein
MNAPCPPDRLDALLRHFSVSARLFLAGALCGSHEFSDDEGYLHIARTGTVEVQHEGLKRVIINQPSLIFYPRPLRHRFITDRDVGADMTCATVRMGSTGMTGMAGGAGPLAHALPPVVMLTLAELPGMQSLLDLLFSEAREPKCGRQAVVNRLFEVLIIQLIRHLMNTARVNTGLIAGLAHPRLALALVALQEAPAEPWTLETLAEHAGMSRSAFAQTFREVVGTTPGDHLAAWRLSLAQDLLRRGRPVKQVALDVGYGSTAALSRVFSARLGASPRAWLAEGRQGR